MTSAPNLLGPSTLPPDDNVNPYCFHVALDGEFFLRHGAMIAYYGQMRFEPLGQTSLASMVAAKFSSPLYSHSWMVATGRGNLLLAQRGLDINSFDLEEGNLTVKAANLLGFAATLELKESIIPGFLTLLGTGKFIAASNGPVMFAEPPIRVDPDALVGWADCPSPCVHHDVGWMQGYLGAARGVMGSRSGEERQYDFTGSGTVLMQSSEKGVLDPALLSRMITEVENLPIPLVGPLMQTLQRRMPNA